MSERCTCTCCKHKRGKERIIEHLRVNGAVGLLHLYELFPTYRPSTVKGMVDELEEEKIVTHYYEEHDQCFWWILKKEYDDMQDRKNALSFLDNLKGMK